MLFTVVLLLLVGFVMVISGMVYEEVRTAFFGVIIFVIGAALGFVQENQPTALDVYRGKTVLEITYRNSIPVDTVVVFKK